MRKILWGSIIIITVLTMGINSGFGAEITVGGILNKMQENLAKMNDMKAEIVTTAYMGAQLNTMTQKMKYTFKKPDKYKIETSTPVPQTILIIGETMTMKTADGKISTMNLKQLPGMSSNQQYFGVDITKMFNNYNVTLNETLSDRVNNIYVLELIPKDISQSTSQMGAFMPSRIEMFVDYNKGVIIKQQIYSKGNTLMAITEVKDTRQIEGTWIPISTESTAFLPTGQQVKSEMRFENVQVNMGIMDGEFEIK